MKRLILTVALVFGWSVAAFPAAPAPLTTLREIHALSNEQAKQALPVAFEATITYFRNYEKTMFVQDGDVAIYVQATTNTHFIPGDRILIKGTTHESFRPFVLSNDITLLAHGAVPSPVPVDYDQMIRAEHDCVLVSVRAKVRAVDLVMSSDVLSTSLQLITDGGAIEAVVDSSDSSAFDGLLDADIELTGAFSGRFDGKMQQTGVLLHVTSWANVKVLQRAVTTPESLPVTSMDQVLKGYHVQVLSQRIRVHGTITYSQPGSSIVLQEGARSLWIQTRSISPVHVGDLADVTGFPGLRDGFLSLTEGEIKDKHVQAPIVPHPATWRQLVMSGNVFDLVSIEGKVVSVIREAAQDEYVLSADGQIFSAIYRHPPSTRLNPEPPPPLKQVPEQSVIRVTGICMLDDSNPFNAQVPFTILMRSYNDIAVVADPSLLNIRNLLVLVAFLLLVVFSVGVRGWTLERKVRRQTAALAARTETEAARERHIAQLEHRRGRILEDINGPRPLVEILEQIVDLVSFSLEGVPCWCAVTDGARLGTYPHAPESLRVVSEPIPSRSGPPLGTLSIAFPPRSHPAAAEAEALTRGARLATLAIETRRLYSDLVHRSEFDLLTDLHNRFSLDRLLEMRIDQARENASIFGLIYIDLDEFKQVNDLYGHQIGDLYLQEVALRMKRQLRSHDLLARLGGDEFAALVSVIPNRSGLEEIAQRLERCLDEPFAIEGYLLSGSASAGIALYPEDGSSRDSLFSAADAAMYVAKHSRRSRAKGLHHRQWGEAASSQNS